MLTLGKMPFELNIRENDCKLIRIQFREPSTFVISKLRTDRPVGKLTEIPE